MALIKNEATVEIQTYKLSLDKVFQQSKLLIEEWIYSILDLVKLPKELCTKA